MKIYENTVVLFLNCQSGVNGGPTGAKFPDVRPSVQ